VLDLRLMVTVACPNRKRSCTRTPIRTTIIRLSWTVIRFR